MRDGAHCNWRNRVPLTVHVTTELEVTRQCSPLITLTQRGISLETRSVRLLRNVCAIHHAEQRTSEQ
jgi:hypothetical protein